MPSARLNPRVRPRVIRVPPGWVLRGGIGPANGAAPLDLDFQNDRYWGYAPGTGLTVSRASAAYQDYTNGIWQNFASGVLRRTDKGLLIEEARTNLALWCRDFTNAAWVKTTMTTALTATGIDGVINSASTLTAANALATALQTIVQVSTADAVSFFVKRRTGVGTVSVTGDGTTYTDITANLSTTAWYRATVQATLVNPVIGVRISTNADAVDVDFAQLEAGTFATSPIATTTVAVARAADIITLNSPPNFGLAYSMFAQGIVNAPTGYGAQQAFFYISDGTQNNRAFLDRLGGTGATRIAVLSGNVQTFNAGGDILAANVRFKSAGAFILNNASGYTNGAVESISVAMTTMAVGPKKINIGSNATSGQLMDGYIERVALWPAKKIPDAVLQSLTT